MKYQTVLFDMDGTLLDTLTDMEAAVNHILTQYGYPVRTLEEVRRFVGNGAGLLIHRALPQGVDPAREAEVLAAYRAYYQAHNCIRTRPYEGIPELLAACAGRGCGRRWCPTSQTKPPGPWRPVLSGAGRRPGPAGRRGCQACPGHGAGGAGPGWGRSPGGPCMWATARWTWTPPGTRAWP